MTGYDRAKEGRLPRSQARVQNRMAALRDDLDAAQTDADRVTAAYDFFRSALRRTKAPNVAEEAANAAVDLLTDMGTKLLTAQPVTVRESGNRQSAAGFRS
jgi:hypothetical protein